MEVTGLGIDQEGREGIRITQEEHVGQGYVTPIETTQMQPDQEDRQGINQTLGRIGAEIARKECTVGQGEFQMLCDQHGLQGLPIPGVPPGDHGNRIDRGQLQLLELAEQLILPFGHPLGYLLHGIYVIAHMDEADHVPGDAAGQISQKLLWPGRQWVLPGEGEHLRIGT